MGLGEETGMVGWEDDKQVIAYAVQLLLVSGKGTFFLFFLFSWSKTSLNESHQRTHNHPKTAPTPTHSHTHPPNLCHPHLAFLVGGDGNSVKER